MKSLFKISRQEIKRVLIHIPLGLLTVIFGYWVGWWLAIVFAAGFWLYEVNEDYHISDEAWKDLKGFLWGCGIAGIIMVGLKLGGIV